MFPVMYPAKYPEVIAVGAHNAFGETALFSNMGPEVDLLAPGVDIVSTNRTDDSVLGACSGTSMASPQVAGAVAMMLAYDRQLHSYLETPGQIKMILRQTSAGVGQGAGLLNLVGALEAVAAINGEGDR